MASAILDPLGIETATGDDPLSLGARPDPLGLESPAPDLADIKSSPVNQPSQFSSGLPASVPNSDNPDWSFVKTAGVPLVQGLDQGSKLLGKSLDTAGKLVWAGGEDALGKVLSTFPKYAASDDPENINAIINGEEMPAQTALEGLPPVQRAIAGGVKGLVESTPRLAIAAEDPLLAGPLAFGMTPQGFDPKQAAMAAVLPMVGRLSGAVTEAIATKAGVTSDTAQAVLNKLGGATGAAGLIGADEWARISQLPPEQRQAALTDAMGNIGSMFLLGTMGERTKIYDAEKPNPPGYEENLRNVTRSSAPSGEAIADPLGIETVAPPNETLSQKNEAPAAMTQDVTAPGDGRAPAATLAADGVTVLHPDGTPDPISTMLNTMGVGALQRAGPVGETPDVQPAAPVHPLAGRVADIAQSVQELQAALNGNQLAPAPAGNSGSVQTPPSEPAVTSANNPGLQGPSPPVAATAPAAPAASLSTAVPKTGTSAGTAANTGATAALPGSPTPAEKDEQSALETVQEAVGFNKAQSARLQVLQNKSAAGIGGPSQGQSKESGGAVPRPRVTNLGAPNTPQTTPVVNVARGVRARKVFDNVTEMAAPDVLSWMADNMRMMSKSDARNTLGKAWWQKNASLYDDAAPLKSPVHNVIYGGKSRPDQVAQAAYDARIIKQPDVSELWGAIHRASERRANAYETARHQEKFLQQQMAEHTAWLNAVGHKQSGLKPVTAQDLKVGDVLDVDGERVRVIDRDETTGDVTLKDGTRFGRQTLPNGQTIHVEKVEESAEKYAAGDSRGLSVEDATAAIHSALGTSGTLPHGIRVIRDDSAAWGARIEGRNKITVNAAQISSKERARQVILEEGLHGVWLHPDVQAAWQAIRGLVTPEEMRAEFLKRQAQGLPTDEDTIREEAAIHRLLQGDATKGLFARLWAAVRAVISRIFGFDFRGSADQLKAAAKEFLRGNQQWRDMPSAERFAVMDTNGLEPSVDQYVQLMSRRDDMIGDFQVPDGYRLKDIQTSKWDSVYWMVETPDGDELKIRISNHGSKPTAHGPNDYEGEVPEHYTLPQFRRSMDAAEDWLSKKAGENVVDFGTRQSNNEEWQPSTGKTNYAATGAPGQNETQKPPKPTATLTGKLQKENSPSPGAGRSSTPIGGNATKKLSGANRALTQENLSDVRFATGDRPERERSLPQVKAELSAAQDELQRLTRETGKPDRGTTNAEHFQARNVAGATYRNLREELLHHPDYVAEQLAKQHAAVTTANAILKPLGKAAHPDEAPNPNELQQQLAPADFKKYQAAQEQLSDSAGELQKMPAKMVARIYAEMQADGRLPEGKPFLPEAGRTLDRVTDWLRSHNVDSPNKSLAERLNLGARAAQSLHDLKTTAQKALATAQGISRAAVASYSHPPKDDDFRSIIKSWLFADQRTGLATHQFVKALVDKVPDADRRKAMSVWLDAGGDQSLIRFQSDAVPDIYRKPWELAQKLTPDEQALALKIKEDFAEKLADAQKVGIIDQGRAEYGVPQRWKIKPDIDRAPSGASAQKGSPGRYNAKLDPRSPFFSFQRETPSYFDGIMAKGVPENLDIAHLVATYDAAFHKSLSSRAMIAALQQARAADGLPVTKISGSASVSHEGGKAYFVDSRAWNKSDVSVDGRPYRSVDHSALKGWKIAFKDEAGNPILVKGDMLVHPDHFAYLKNELGESKLREGAIGAVMNPVLKSQAFLKASKLSASAFHLMTIGEHMASHLVNPFTNGFQIDLRQPDQALLVRNGLELGMGGPQQGFEEGLASGHSGLFNMLPGLGDFSAKMTDFIFKEYIPRIMMKTGLHLLQENRARYGQELSADEVAEVTAHQMNAAGGLQNYRLRGADGNLWGRLGADKTYMDLQRLALMAPQFLEARLRVVGQAFKPYGHAQRKLLVLQALILYAGARVLNYLLDNGNAHWKDNPFSVVHNGRAYSIRTIVGDFWHLLTNPASFLAGRLSPIAKMGMEDVSGGGRDLRTGARKDIPLPTQNPIGRLAENLVMDLANWLTPIPVEGLLPGSAGRDQTAAGMALASVGVGSRKFTNVDQIRQLAADFNRGGDAKAQSYQANRDNGAFGHSAYAKLDALLDAGKTSAAKTEYQALLQDGKTPGQIAARYDRNTYFSGSAAREAQFKASLTPAQAKIYSAAQAEQMARATAFRAVR